MTKAKFIKQLPKGAYTENQYGKTEAHCQLKSGNLRIFGKTCQKRSADNLKPYRVPVHRGDGATKIPAIQSRQVGENELQQLSFTYSITVCCSHKFLLTKSAKLLPA